MSTTWVPAPPAADTFASRLRLLRLALDDSTIEEMAKRCQVPAPTWRTWERGARPHGLDQVVQRIVKATGVDRDWLMWGHGAGVDTPELTSQERAVSSGDRLLSSRAA